MAHDVFISYSSNDQQAALAVLHGLEAAGIRCWMAPRDIPPGAIWAQAIMDGIAGCRVLVVVFSTSANRSTHVLTEVDAAVRKGAVIVPFRIEDVLPDGALEYHLRTRHWLDALTPDLEEHVGRLAGQLRTILASGRPPDPPTPPPRPMPPDLPRPPRRRRWRLTAGRLKLLGAAAVLMTAGGYWWSRPRVVNDAAFTVHEVSAGGGNETTLHVEALGLRFFEGPSTIAPLAQREYATTFRDDITRTIKAELTLKYDPPGRVVQFPFGCVVRREGAQIIATLPLTATVQAQWDSSFHVASAGGTAPGNWDPGRYRVECRYDNTLVARDWFTIAAGGFAVPEDAPTAQAAELAPLHARVAAIRLFASGEQLGDRQDWVYAHRFDRATTRYINTEVNLVVDAVPRATHATLTCRYLRNRTEEIGRVTLTYDMTAGATAWWAATGWGYRNAPGWATGTYLVACDDGVTTLGQTGFEVY